MGIVIAAALALALLYAWLMGWWFARVVVFLGMAGICFLFTMGRPETIVVAIACSVLAWFISGLPIYFWRWRIRGLQADYLASAGQGAATPGHASSVSVQRVFPSGP